MENENVKRSAKASQTSHIYQFGQITARPQRRKNTLNNFNFKEIIR